MRYINKSKEGKAYVNQQLVQMDILNTLFDIKDKKTVNKLRAIISDWNEAEVQAREEYINNTNNGVVINTEESE